MAELLELSLLFKSLIMDRKSFLFSIPLIGLVAKALSKPDEPTIETIGIAPEWGVEYAKSRTIKKVRIQKCDDGLYLIHDPETGVTCKGNFIWTDDAEIKLV